METPVPDLIYYQRIVDDKRIQPDHIRGELQDLINDIKQYLGKIQRRPNKVNRPDPTQCKCEKPIINKYVCNCGGQI